MEDLARNDPVKLREFAGKLKNYSQSIKQSEQEVRNKTGRLSSHWRDQEYDRFRNCMEATYKFLESLAHEVDRVTPSLMQAAEDLERYLRTRE
ncbi:MAG: WXG100 family type VII secretion target [Armatimonadetes bacterium]|nr:WXG100 family type VII secretion target [Armatimonadota bacterium]